MVLFLAQMVFGLLAAWQFLAPDFLFGVLDFNVNRMVHINAMVVWMLYGFIGSIYWLVEDEAGVPLVGPRLANLTFWVLTAAVTVVVVVYLVVQSGPGDVWTLWLINEGREYIEAPRWADIGIVLCMLAFFYNVAATFVAGRWSGISGVLVLDLVALAGLYLAGMFYTTNLPMDQYWWWVIHLWVEATWEVLVGCIMAWGLIYTTIIVAFIYLALQRLRGDVWMSGALPGAWRWKWALALLHIGMVGMTMALLIAGYEQSFVERAAGGSTWQACFDGQTQPWFVQAMWWRMAFGIPHDTGFVVLLIDFLKIGAGETRPIRTLATEQPEAPAAPGEPEAVPAGGG